MSKISVRDFKSMIEGMDTVLGENWLPNAEQWKKIRERIRQLDDTPPPALSPPAIMAAGGAGGSSSVVTYHVSGATPNVVDPNEEKLLRAFPQVPGSVPTSVPVGGEGPSGPSAFSAMPKVGRGPTVGRGPVAPITAPSAPPRQATLTPEVIAKLDPASRNALLKQNAVKTPDIDTSAGKGYNSSFV